MRSPLRAACGSLSPLRFGSTRKVTKIVEELCGHSVSSTQVSVAAAKLAAELQSWRDRPLGSCSYMILDARYEKVRQGGQLLNCAVLSEAEVHWRNFLASLQSRGLHGLSFIVSDAHLGLAAARATVFPSVPWQRCQFHLQQNAQAYVPHLDRRASVASDIRSIFNCPVLPSAQARLNHLVASYAQAAPKLSAWMEKNIPEGFAVDHIVCESLGSLKDKTVPVQSFQT